MEDLKTEKKDFVLYRMVPPGELSFYYGNAKEIKEDETREGKLLDEEGDIYFFVSQF
jgi:hypothetical protein